MSRKILIVGFSARAAAFSCLRAGLTPGGIDCFADADLAAHCEAVKVHNYPRDLLKLTRSQSASAWLYTGALENHPGLVDRMSEALPLLGNRGRSLRRVRDPWELQRTLSSHGLRFPMIRRDPPPTDAAQWLLKRRKSSGGAHVYCCDNADGATSPVFEASMTDQWYYQEQIEGETLSAVYVAAHGHAVLIGATWQLVGLPWTGAGRFAYCGSIGPLALADPLYNQFCKLGNALASEFNLQGLFGVDTIVQNDRAWLIEVNPRYTASVEVLERGLDIDAAALHVAACQTAELPQRVPRLKTGVWGKAIVYARHPVVVSEPFCRLADYGGTTPWMRNIADVPQRGTRIEKGAPLTTVFASGKAPQEALRRLRNSAENVQRLLK